MDRETFRLKLWRQKYTFRVAANWQAVTRVNLEQASKVQMWKPTRPIFGEGRSGTGKKPIYAPVSVHRGNEDGMSGKRFMQRGRPISEVGWRLTTALQVLEWTRSVMERMGLELNEEKTVIRNARKEQFDFLGYTFGMVWFNPDIAVEVKIGL